MFSFSEKTPWMLRRQKIDFSINAGVLIRAANHNHRRLTPLIDAIRARGYGIQIEHDYERLHYIEIVKEEGMSNSTVPQRLYSTLAEHKMFQHNSCFRQRDELSREILKQMEEKLIYLEELKARAIEAAEAAEKRKKYEFHE